MRLPLLWVMLIAAAACRSEPPKPPPEPPPACEPLARVPSLAHPGACDGDWCWANPLPQGLPLRGVYSPRPGVAWIVGDGGTLLRAEGTQVTGIASSTHEDLTDVWGSSDADVWAVGKAGTLLHWDGTRWNRVNSPAGTGALLTISGVSATSAWIGGADGWLMYWDGSTWTPVASGTTADVVDVWAAEPGAAWVVAGNTALRCTPGGCLAVPGEDPSFAPKRVSGATKDDVYFLSGDLHVFRWNAGAWTQISLDVPIRTAYDLKVTGPEELWIAFDLHTIGGIPKVVYHSGVLHWRQGQSSELLMMNEGTNVDGEAHYYLRYFPSHALAVSSRDDIWAVGKGGRIRRREGSTERELLRGTPVTSRYAYGASNPTLANFLFASIAELPATEDGSTPMRVGVAAGGERIWVAGPRDVWTATTVVNLNWTTFNTMQVHRSQEGQQSKVLERSRDTHGAWNLIGIHGSSTSNVWVVDWSGLYRYAGAEWTHVLPRDLEDPHFPYTGPVWAFDAEDVWFGGTHGLHHWNGTALEETSVPGFSVNALWASWKRDLWAVGSRDGKPHAERWDGSRWSEVPLPAEADGLSSLVHVTGRCPGEVYLIGDRAAVFRWDGAQLHTVPVPMRITLLSAARIGSELWVTGAVPNAPEPYYFDNTPVIIRTPWQSAP